MDFNLPNLDNETKSTLTATAWAIVWAVVGRVLFHANLVRIGKRKRFLSMLLAWELFIAIGMGVIAGAFADALHVVGTVKAGLISAIAYLGPRVMEAFEQILERKAGVIIPEDEEAGHDKR